MTPAAVFDVLERRRRLARALKSIDDAIARPPRGADISGLERLRADIAEALSLAERAPHAAG